MRSLSILLAATIMTGCATADMEAFAGAMAGELANQAKTGTGFYTNPYANQPPAPAPQPYRCVSTRNASTGNVTTTCR